MRNKSLMRLAVCLIGMAAMVLQGCSESGTDRDKLCGLSLIHISEPTRH